MSSVFIGQTEVNGGSGTISVPVPVGTATGDFMIAFGIARQTPAGASYTFGPNVWTSTVDSINNAGDTNPAFAFCTRKLNAGETELTLTESGGTLTLISVVLQVWRGTAQLFAGPVGEYLVNNGFTVLPPVSATGPTGDAAPTAIIGGNIAFATAVSIDSVIIDDSDAIGKGYTSYLNSGTISLNVRGFTQGEGGSLYPGPEWSFTPATLNCATFLIGFSGAPEPVSPAEWALPALQWSATGTVETFIVTGGVKTKRFDDGEGSEWWLVAPLVDSGNELRSKTVRASHATGRFTNAESLVYAYDVGTPIVLDDLENGTNSATGAIPITDSTEVAQSARAQVNCLNAVLHTIRLQGDDRGQPVRDEVHEVVYEVSIAGVRR